MYIITAISTLLALGTLATASPLPESDNTPNSATVVDVASSSYSSLIVFNPAAAPTSSGSSGSDIFLTPSGVTLPQASATLSLQQSLPSVSTLGTASESGHVRVVGQDSSTTEGAGQEEMANSGSVISMSGWLGAVACGSALVMASGLV